MAFKDRLKKLTEIKRVSNYRIAKETNISRSTISNYLDGKTKPNMSHVKLIADYFGVSENWLLNGDGNMVNAHPNGVKENRKHYLYVLFDKLQMSPKEFSKSIGLKSPERLYRVLRGESKISRELMNLITKTYPDISPGWLGSGIGEVLTIDDVAEKSRRRFRFLGWGISEVIPLFDISDYAYCYSFEDIYRYEGVVGDYEIPSFKYADWMLLIKDNSMHPIYSIGDSIACDVTMSRHKIQFGSIYVFTSRVHGLLVRRLKESEKDDCLLAVPENDEYNTIEISLKEITGFALIVGVIKNELFIEKEISEFIIKKAYEVGRIALSEISQICIDKSARYNIVMYYTESYFNAIDKNKIRWFKLNRYGIKYAKFLNGQKNIYNYP